MLYTKLGKVCFNFYLARLPTKAYIHNPYQARMLQGMVIITFRGCTASATKSFFLELKFGHLMLTSARFMTKFSHM